MESIPKNENLDKIIELDNKYIELNNKLNLLNSQTKKNTHVLISVAVFLFALIIMIIIIYVYYFSQNISMTKKNVYVTHQLTVGEYGNSNNGLLIINGPSEFNDDVKIQAPIDYNNPTLLTKETSLIIDGSIKLNNGNSCKKLKFI